ncbi:MAG: electron transfer flavoprotein subunit beta/FixA family protein [Calditrichaeota bacterium]|nr:MAG: electron transfer flavoprotein subunit beta/FixA family protein [Calditrichota bacterium]
MKIAILLKQVPVKDATLELSGDNTWIDEDDVQFEINDSDHYGLAEALNIAKANDGEVTVVTMGPDRVKDSIKQALAKGAHKAIHIDDEEMSSTDPLTRAKVIAEAIKDENFDLILSGLQSDDFGYGQTGVLIAEILGMPHATLVVETEILEGKIKVKRELEGGWFQNAELPLPALLSIQSGLTDIPYATIKGIMMAKKKPVAEVDADDLGVDLDTGAFKLQKIYTPVKSKETVVLDGDADSIVSQLIDKLKNEAKVL